MNTCTVTAAVRILFVMALFVLTSCWCQSHENVRDNRIGSAAMHALRSESGVILLGCIAMDNDFGRCGQFAPQDFLSARMDQPTLAEDVRFAFRMASHSIPYSEDVNARDRALSRFMILADIQCSDLGYRGAATDYWSRLDAYSEVMNNEFSAESIISLLEDSSPCVIVLGLQIVVRDKLTGSIVRAAMTRLEEVGVCDESFMPTLSLSGGLGVGVRGYSIIAHNLINRFRKLCKGHDNL